MSKLRTELESDRERRRFGTGWLSGTAAVVLAVVGFGTVLCLRYPDLLTVPDAREFYNVGVIRLALHLVLNGAFVLGAVSIVLRDTKVLGFAAMGLVLAAAVLGKPLPSTVYLDPRFGNLLSTVGHPGSDNFAPIAFSTRYVLAPDSEFESVRSIALRLGLCVRGPAPLLREALSG